MDFAYWPAKNLFMCN